MRILRSFIRGRKREWGFTLVELMVAITLSTFVVLGGGEMLRQLILASMNNGDETVAVIQLQNAAFWVTQDSLQAQALECFDPAADPEQKLLTLNWTDWEGAPHSVTYLMGNMTDEMNRQLWMLVRYDAVADSSVMISEFLDPAGTSCSWNDAEGLLELNVTAIVDNATEARSFDIQPRALE